MKLRVFAVAVVYFVAVIVVAHFFVPPGYDWRQNTISDLASQGHLYRWIMQAGFVGFGLILSGGAVFYFARQRRGYFLGMVVVYGVSILLSGIFCTAPIDPALPVAVREAELHSLFATTAGVGLSLAILWQVAAAPGRQEKRNHLIFLVLVMGLSGLFGLAENGMVGLDKGIVQRLLYLSGLGWLVYQERIFVTGK